MLHYLSDLTDWLPALRIFKYITFRACGGAATAFLLSVGLGPWVIGRLRALRVRQYERQEFMPTAFSARREKKEGTPTMGGVLIVLAVLVAALLWAKPANVLVLLSLATLCVMGGIGFLDDYAKLRGKNTRGLRARTKLLLQVCWALAVALALLTLPQTRDHVRQLIVPFWKHPVLMDMGTVFTLVFVCVVIVGASNAVNLTDGLDGLAIGCSSSAALAYLVMAYVAGNKIFAEHLLLTYVPGGGELVVLCGCLLGASLGFLWYNCHPAQVFMGDTGSLALGGFIAMIAILIKQELALILVGGVFVMEALSVILQVIGFRLTGRRLFKMSPLHHHFELSQWSETQVTIRFWILSILFALLGVATLKVR